MTWKLHSSCFCFSGAGITGVPIMPSSAAQILKFPILLMNQHPSFEELLYLPSPALCAPDSQISKSVGTCLLFLPPPSILLDWQVNAPRYSLGMCDPGILGIVPWSYEEETWTVIEKARPQTCSFWPINFSFLDRSSILNDFDTTTCFPKGVSPAFYPQNHQEFSAEMLEVNTLQLSLPVLCRAEGFLFLFLFFWVFMLLFCCCCCCFSWVRTTLLTVFILRLEGLSWRDNLNLFHECS